MLTAGTQAAVPGKVWWRCVGAVCIKAGDLALALDVFKEMNEKGCTPNLVTYNILIDVRCPNPLLPLPARALCLLPILDAACTDLLRQP